MTARRPRAFPAGTPYGFPSPATSRIRPNGTRRLERMASRYAITPDSSVIRSPDPPLKRNETANIR